MTAHFNDNLVMICGDSGAGKSASFRNLLNPEGVMYLNGESNKKLPFRSQFHEYSITDPYQVHEAFNHAETLSDIHTIIIDSQTFLMEMFESIYVLPSANTMDGWSIYAQYFKFLMRDLVAKSTKNVLFTAHVESILNEQTMIIEKKIPVKGQLGKKGIEAYFSTIVFAKTIPLTDLKAYANPLLVITEDDKLVGYKHVFQTRKTKETTGERMRAPMGMWSVKETYIDNDCQLLINRLNKFYKGDA